MRVQRLFLTTLAALTACGDASRSEGGDGSLGSVADQAAPAAPPEASQAAVGAARGARGDQLPAGQADSAAPRMLIRTGDASVEDTTRRAGWTARSTPAGTRSSPSTVLTRSRSGGTLVVSEGLRDSE